MFNPTATRGPCTFRSGPLLAGAHTLGHQYVRNHLDNKGPGPQMRPDVGQRQSRRPDGCGCGAGDPRVLGGVSAAEPNGSRHGAGRESLPVGQCSGTESHGCLTAGSNRFVLAGFRPLASDSGPCRPASCRSPTSGCGLAVALFPLACSFVRLAPRVPSAWGLHLRFPRPYTAEPLLDKYCLCSYVRRVAVGCGSVCLLALVYDLSLPPLSPDACLPVIGAALPLFL